MKIIVSSWISPITAFINRRSLTIMSYLIATVLILSIGSCRKMVEVDPPFTRLSEANVYAQDNTAIQVLTGIYVSLSRSSSTSGTQGLSLYMGLSADEFKYYGNTDRQLRYYQNSLISDGTMSDGLHWSYFYSFIYKVNAAIEGLSASTTLSNSLKQQLLGEAKFLRGFFYFYLVNMFGDAPLTLSTDWEVNRLLPRSPKSQIYRQIILDLLDAENLLSEKYLDGSLQPYTLANTERVRPTKWAATALLARVYLYTDDFVNAEEKASIVIMNSNLFGLLSTLNNVFLKNSSEAIWQLQPVITSHNTEEAWLYKLTSTGPGSSKPVSLSSFLLKSFESNDQRRKNWIDSVIVGGVTYYYPAKYKSATLNAPLTEYLTVFRLAEQYLIRAEARAKQNKVVQAIADLDAIRRRVGLPLIATVNPNIGQQPLLDQILRERQVELFTEFGHRWLDLKRTGNVDVVMNSVTPLKSPGLQWHSYQQLYPLPFDDIDKNINLTQNFGY